MGAKDYVKMINIKRAVKDEVEKRLSNVKSEIKKDIEKSILKKIGMKGKTYKAADW
jgi:tetrahydromethanopterin S-methyltransferase subunit G